MSFIILKCVPQSRNSIPYNGALKKMLLVCVLIFLSIWLEEYKEIIISIRRCGLHLTSDTSWGVYATREHFLSPTCSSKGTSWWALPVVTLQAVPSIVLQNFLECKAKEYNVNFDLHKHPNFLWGLFLFQPTPVHLETVANCVQPRQPLCPSTTGLSGQAYLLTPSQTGSCRNISIICVLNLAPVRALLTLHLADLSSQTKSVPPSATRDISGLLSSRGFRTASFISAGLPVGERSSKQDLFPQQACYFFFMHTIIYKWSFKNLMTCFFGRSWIRILASGCHACVTEQPLLWSPGVRLSGWTEWWLTSWVTHWEDLALETELTNTHEWKRSFKRKVK